MSQYPVENLLREATEAYSALTLLSLAALAYYVPHMLLLTHRMGLFSALSLGALGCYRSLQSYRVKRYHRRLIRMPHFAMSTTEIPISKKWLYVGNGFRWWPHHTQRLHQIKQVHNESFMQRGRLFQQIRTYCMNHEKTRLAQLFNHTSWLNPFRPDPDVGGKPYLHGLGDEDKPVFIPQSVRAGHTFVVGTTRVGKTRLASILINQDIRMGDAVIVVDPKGDFELLRDMYSACYAAGRLDDFKIVHVGFPESSASYNPLKNYDQISEVATRITDAIAAEGEGKQFAAFAWKYINIVAICLEEMKQPITYKSIAFNITRLDQLLVAYADSILPGQIPDYKRQVQEIMHCHEARIDKNGHTPLPMERAKAVISYLKQYITNTIAEGNVETLHDQVLIDLYDAAIMDKNYYDKITASVGPVLSEINKSGASDIFSFNETDSEIELMNAIKQKQVIYIGLDSLTNPNVAQAVGKALLSDLVSTAGKIYKEPNAKYRLNLHCDELAEFIQDSFVKILNKAGGAGFQVTAYAQTKQDLEVALGCKAMAEVTKGNLNTLIMLRVENEETANLLVKVVGDVNVVNHTQISMVNDSPRGEDGVYFNTTNEDRVQMVAVPMISVNDIVSLPKGQAFLLVNGGEFYKIRIPLPINDGLAPSNLETLISEMNKKTVGFSSLHKSTEKKISTSTEVVTNLDMPEEVTYFEKPENFTFKECLPGFISWLSKRISSGNQLFSLEAQNLVCCDPKRYGDKTVFLLPEVLIKYQERSGISQQSLKSTLFSTFSEGYHYHLSRHGCLLEVFPCQLNEAFAKTHSTQIFKEKSDDNIN